MFIIRTNYLDGHDKHIPVADFPVVSFTRETRVARHRNVGGLRFNVIEYTGRLLRGTVEISAPHHARQTKATAAGVHEALREAQQRDADELARIDAAIAEHQQAIAELREERVAELGLAFQRGKRVELRRVVEAAESRVRG